MSPNSEWPIFYGTNSNSSTGPIPIVLLTFERLLFHVQGEKLYEVKISQYIVQEWELLQAVEL